jgi:hypothetical protein
LTISKLLFVLFLEGVTRARFKYMNAEIAKSTNITKEYQVIDVIDLQPKEQKDGTFSTVCRGDSGSGIFGKDTYNDNRYTLFGIVSYAFGPDVGTVSIFTNCKVFVISLLFSAKRT